MKASGGKFVYRTGCSFCRRRWPPRTNLQPVFYLPRGLIDV